jgi:chromosome segregation ATPase
LIQVEKIYCNKKLNFCDVQNSKFDSAIESLSDCAEEAAKMAELSQKLFNQSLDLYNKSQQASLSTTEDEVFSKALKDKIQIQRNDISAQKAFLESKRNDLTEQLRVESEKEQAAAAKADKVHQRAFIIGILSTLMKPITQIGDVFKIFNPQNYRQASSSSKNAIHIDTEKLEKLSAELTAVKQNLEKKKEQLSQEESKGEKSDKKVIADLKKEIKELDVEMKEIDKLAESVQSSLQNIQISLDDQASKFVAQEENAAARRSAVQKERMGANAELAKSIERLNQLNEEDDDIGKALTSLEIAITTLGKIAAIFDNACLFWQRVEIQCKQLANLKKITRLAKDQDAERFTEKVLENAWDWLVLGKINVMANIAIKDAYQKVSDNMSKLPTKAETKKIIAEATKNLSEGIKNETKHVVNIKEIL